MFEARYLMKRLLLHVLFSQFLCVIFLSIILLSQFHFVARKNRSNVKTNFIFCLSTESRLISTSSGIVMALALKTKMGNK